MVCAQVRRRDIKAHGDSIDDSRLETIQNVLMGEETGSSPTYDRVFGNFAMLRQVSKIAIGFGQVLGSFQHV